ncbi:hypothetical protein F4810DRAFT_677442 [Camillea tinctor]|nr:hypothetical protein F4810DRAFT_677442 [Camillea tinctor]
MADIRTAEQPSPGSSRTSINSPTHTSDEHTCLNAGEADDIELRRRHSTSPQMEQQERSGSSNSSTNLPTRSQNSYESVRVTSEPFRVESFADKKSLSGWFPKINDNEKTSRRIRTSKRIWVLMLQIIVVTVVFLANLALAIYATTKYPSTNGVGLIYSGDCSVVNNLNYWIHLLINLFSTGMLSASNYCAQIQAAPTRKDIDHAHKQGFWLDIGVPSLKNIRYIKGRRWLSCIVLALTSIPIHLLYNSVVFQSLGSSDYTIAVVTESFVFGEGWSLTAAEANRKGDPGWDESRVNPPQNYTKIISDMQQEVENGLYTTQNVSSCFDYYNDYWSPQGNGVIVVRNNTPVTEGSLLLYVSVVPRWDNWPKNMWAISRGELFRSIPPPLPVTTWMLGPPQYDVAYCLTQPLSSPERRCRFEYSTYILYTVCVLNLTMGLTMGYVWIVMKRQNRTAETNIESEGEEPCHNIEDVGLSTLGDAIASFMQRPDTTTKNMCLATKYDFSIPNNKKKSRQSESQCHPREWKQKPERWAAAATRKQWIYLLLLYVLYIIGMGVITHRFLISLGHRRIPTTLTGLWDLGFGSLTPWTYLVVDLPRKDPVGLVSNVLVINSPQLLFSLSHTLYNAVLTTLLVQHEFSLMYSGDKRKPLRVSEPVGIQRSSYFISLPMRYGIPLYLASSIVHWLTSQSFFLARITALTPDGSQDYDNSFSTLAFSPIAMIITTMVLGLHIVTLMILALRRYDGVMCMVSTNSKAISAACHCPSEDSKYGYQLPIQWGVVEIGEDGIGHCAFTTASTHSLRQPEEGVLYQ